MYYLNLELESTGTDSPLTHHITYSGCGAYESDEIQNKAMLSQLRLQLGPQLGLA